MDLPRLGIFQIALCPFNVPFNSIDLETSIEIIIDIKYAPIAYRGFSISYVLW